MAETVHKWVRIAAGDYETEDGRYRIYQIPDLRPAAWNVEAVWTDAERVACVDVRMTYERSELVVDGAASFRDAKALFAEAVADYEAERRKS